VSGAPLRGEVAVPGDKSVTQRALLLGAFADGTTHVTGALRAGDTLATARVIDALGARLAWAGGEGGRPVPGTGGAEAGDSAATLRIEGAPAPAVPAAPLDCGNAGTLARLLAGLLAGREGTWTLDGDASLRARPMDRVATPLRAMGAEITTERGRLPLVLRGRALRGTRHVLEVPSAQVKSALLLAGLSADGPTTVVQHAPTRDHTERMLPAFGARVRVVPGEATVEPGPLRGADVRVPGDPSAAAFLAVAAAIVPGSRLVLRDVGLWPRRTGFLRALERAGVPIVIAQRRGRAPGAVPLGGTAMTEGAARGRDPHGDLLVSHGPLAAFDVAPADVPDCVDEIPILAVAAACAEGTSTFAGLGELRVKESDRVAAIAGMLDDLGVCVALDEDVLRITGRPEGFARGATLRGTRGERDHRMVMAAIVAGLRAPEGEGVEVEAGAAEVSFPGFGQVLAALGT